MCDVRTRFFRPWNGEAAEIEPETSKINSPINNNNNNNENDNNNDSMDTVSVKCEDLADEEDNESVASSTSSATSETGSYHSSSLNNGPGDRRQSVSSSCSAQSCGDLPEAGSLDMLSNFVFGPRAKTTRTSGIENSSSNSSCASSSSPKSAFRPTAYQCPVYSALDYFSPLGIGNPENPATSFDPNYSHHHHHHHQQQLLYGLPGIPIGPYTNSVEEAVKYIHQQDAAAKQMKKLRPKKFRCEHCDVAFSNNGQLKGHVRIHTGERPFKCDAEGCGKSFTRNEELTRHKRIHTGLRPHSCVLCGKRFGRKDHLKKHTRTHDNRAAYHIPASALGPFALNHHVLPPGHPMAPYMYPM